MVQKDEVKRNRLYRADYKVIIEELKKEGIKADLIYLDPPFNSNRTYSMIFNHGGFTAQQKAFHDMWDFTDSTRQLVLDFRDELDKWDLPDSFKEFMRAWLKILEGGNADDRKLLNYLIYMTQRLVLLRDVLKPDGSIYFHCDPVASHYIKVIMDGLMGRNNFQNEVIWKRTSAHSSENKFGQIHDVILFYSMGAKYTWNPVFQPYDEDYIKKNYRHRGPLGRYRPSDLTGAGTSSGESGQPWRGYNPTVRGRHWAIPRKVFSNLPESVIAALEELNNMGRIEWPKNPRDKGPGQPQFKRYLRMCCNFQKSARERLVGSTRLRLMQPLRTAC